MEVNTYYKYLLQLLNKEEVIDDKEEEELLKINIYLSLLSLNNHNYKDKIYEEEFLIIDNFLRRVNNYKVKIQLKRKDTEIEEILKEIDLLYEENKKIIDKYNKDKLDILKIITSKDAKEITKLIDKMTKVKMRKENYYEEDNFRRKEIIDIIFKSNYYIDDDMLYIIGIDRGLRIRIEEFYEIFDYLLDIDNYQDIYNSDKIEHKEIIKKIIDMIKKGNYKEISSYEIIPIMMTYLIFKDVSILEDINMGDFKIDNIKITDLYSFANNKDISDKNHAKWEKIVIPNKYLYQKFNELIAKGMYYYQDEMFTIEGIDNNISDFKVSITKDNIMTLLRSIMNECIKITEEI